LAALDRPGRLNAITFAMFDELAGLCREVATDDAVRVFLAGQEGWADSIAGFALALAADLRLASPGARFDAASVRISGSWKLSRVVGLRRATEILFTGGLFDAEYAERIGLVTAIHPAEDLRDRAFDLAEEIIADSPIGMCWPAVVP
jgi:enoyl-CoA hydratase/carnithine racemase